MDGWSVETKPGREPLVRLLRRNVPVTDCFFLDLHHHDGVVVGILTLPNRNGQCQAQVLVQRGGKVTGQNIELITVSSYTRTSSAVPSSSSSSIPPLGATGDNNTLSDAANMELLRYAVGIMGALMALKVVAQITASIIFILPLLYFYLVLTCPKEDTFEAKKELKRVLRGHHLPDDDPKKPRGFLAETLARVQATVTTEIATATGYEVSLVNMGGACVISTVTVPAANTVCYWVGAANKWWYLYSTEMPKD